MFLIAEGGISTKNTLVNTKGAISLSVNTNYIAGISLNVSYTRDEVFVITDRDSLMFTTKGSGFIKDNTYNDLLHFNIGTKALNARIITLNEVLDIYNNSNKMLVLNLDYQGERTDQYTYQLLSLISNYPNVKIYLKSFNKNILSILKKINTKARIGIIINDNNLNNINDDYDFYVVNSYSVDKDVLIRKINSNKLIMTELISNGSDLINYYYRYDNYILNNLYVISDNTSQLYKDIKLIEK